MFPCAVHDVAAMTAAIITNYMIIHSFSTRDLFAISDITLLQGFLFMPYMHGHLHALDSSDSPVSPLSSCLLDARRQSQWFPGDIAFSALLCYTLFICLFCIVSIVSARISFVLCIIDVIYHVRICLHVCMYCRMTPYVNDILHARKE